MRRGSDSDLVKGEKKKGPKGKEDLTVEAKKSPPQRPEKRLKNVSG